MIEFYWSGQQVSSFPTESPGALRWSVGSSFTTSQRCMIHSERKEKQKRGPLFETEVPCQVNSWPNYLRQVEYIPSSAGMHCLSSIFAHMSSQKHCIQWKWYTQTQHDGEKRKTVPLKLEAELLLACHFLNITIQHKDPLLYPCYKNSHLM